MHLSSCVEVSQITSFILAFNFIIQHTSRRVAVKIYNSFIYSTPYLSLPPHTQTRILVTHGIGFLSQCDQIVVMNDGKITEVGSYTELIDNNGAFAEFLRTYTNVEENEEGDPRN